jgi:hypothetical protein
MDPTLHAPKVVDDGFSLKRLFKVGAAGTRPRTDGGQNVEKAVAIIVGLASGIYIFEDVLANAKAERDAELAAGGGGGDLASPAAPA